MRKGGASVAIKIGHESYETPKMVGRHFNEKDELVSRISRQSIDILKENFRGEMTVDDWNLVRKLKTVFQIQ
jgi:translation initiation factor 5B